VVLSGGRAFAVVEYEPLESPVLEEPHKETDFADFLTNLAASASEFERRVLQRFGWNDMAASPVDEYPLSINEPELDGVYAPQTGSTAHFTSASRLGRPQLVRNTGEANAVHEYLVITGANWFYKFATPFGNECLFHRFPDAEKAKVASKGNFKRRIEFFTVSGLPQHCEHAELHGLRDARCLLSGIEGRLCCRACAYHDICWSPADFSRLPCPA
jgi:hypothetical protein